MTLSDLIAAASTNGDDAPLPLICALALGGLVAEDYQHALSVPIGTLPVSVEYDPDAEECTVTVGEMRYDLCAKAEPIADRLCAIEACSKRAAGRTDLTRVCYDHMNTPTRFAYVQFTDAPPTDADRDRIRRESLNRRLDAWETECREAIRRLQGDMRVAASLRPDAAS